MDVLIKGRDLGPCSRLLEALTRAGLLDGKATWEDLPDKIILHVPDDRRTQQLFEGKGFPVFSKEAQS